MANKQNQPKEVKKSALVTAIVKLLKLDDESKIEKFFGRIIKADERLIERKEANLKAKKLQHDQDISKFDDDIEDAQTHVEEAYQNVDLDELKDNASMDAYMDEYLAGIAGMNIRLERLEKEKEACIDAYAEDVKKVKQVIKDLKIRDAKFKS